MGLIRTLCVLALPLVAACKQEPESLGRGYCGVETAADGHDVSQPRTATWRLLMLFDPGNGFFVEDRFRYEPDPSGQEECSDCLDWEQDVYELRWRETRRGLEIKTPKGEEVSDWSCTVSHEGRSPLQGGEELDCRILDPDGASRDIHLSTWDGLPLDGRAGEPGPCPILEIHPPGSMWPQEGEGG